MSIAAKISDSKVQPWKTYWPPHANVKQDNILGARAGDRLEIDGAAIRPTNLQKENKDSPPIEGGTDSAAEKAPETEAKDGADAVMGHETSETGIDQEMNAGNKIRKSYEMDAGADGVIDAKTNRSSKL
ncbi:MAG: hypothetical protein M1820_001814 [Bogoriella megaspora]|nr:MAG: hypothetical protein M1820_001814 [Bogoriella megaspora]